MKIAFIFPGQGSQYVGMGKDFYSGNSHAQLLFEKADEILGFSLSRICFEGPEDELRQTKNTQPAIFLHSMVVLQLMNHVKPAMTAGHSLGEYSALVAAGAMKFEDGLTLVRLRGELMQQAGIDNPGTMAAIIGLTPKVINQVCTDASREGIVQPANFNAPGQIVISGSVRGVHKAMEIAKGLGAKLVKELVVSGAFHSPLIESARNELKKELERTDIQDTSIPVYANVTARATTAAGEIRNLLHQQLTSPVRWEESILNMISDGATEFIEIGPGKILQGLVKRIHASVTVRSIDKISDIQ